MKQILNPFIIGRYVSSKYFCDREAETVLLGKHMDNGRDVTISSKRRMGKTGLIRHFFASDHVKENYLTVFADIFATQTLVEFVYVLSNAVYSAIHSSMRAQIQHFFQSISTLAVGVRFDSNTGDPTFDLRIGQITDPVKTLNQVFSYLDQQPRRVIIALDEFQQIREYPENNTEALLRTLIQQSTNIQFIYSGSNKSIIRNMFLSCAKPFYQSSLFMDLLPLPCDVYGDFAAKLFKENDRILNHDVTKAVYDYTYGVTWYMQVLFNELFAQTPKGGICTKEMIPKAISVIIDSQNQNYLDILSEFSPRQKALLQAIARCEPVQEVTSQKFIEQNGLFSASSVQSALRVLDKKGMVYRENDTIRLQDVFFAKWLKRY